jgi:hypothetical protein
MFTNWPDVADEPDQQAATGPLSSLIAERYFEQLMRWLERKPDEPAQWQHAAHFGDTMLHLTADELLDLAEKEMALIVRLPEVLLSCGCCRRRCRDSGCQPARRHLT